MLTQNHASNLKGCWTLADGKQIMCNKFFKRFKLQKWIRQIENAPFNFTWKLVGVDWMSITRRCIEISQVEILPRQKVIQLILIIFGIFLQIFFSPGQKKKLKSVPLSPYRPTQFIANLRIRLGNFSPKCFIRTLSQLEVSTFRFQNWFYLVDSQALKCYLTSRGIGPTYNFCFGIIHNIA